MSNLTWTEWYLNPFEAALVIAKAHDCEAELRESLLQVFDWPEVDNATFLDDLLTKIAQETNIVVQYDETLGQYRAAWDSR